jgi:thiamine-monophosphate kinase
VNEFELIDSIVAALGDSVRGENCLLGPGDDAAAVRCEPGSVLVSTIDALVADVHFPADAAAELIGYRSLMVALSDLAAMGADASHVLISLTLDRVDVSWVRALAEGMRDAAVSAGVFIAGGNVSRGPLAIHVSAHGFVEARHLLKRDGAKPGDSVYVTGQLGGAAAALQRGRLARSDDLDELNSAYFRPRARLLEGRELRGVASSAMDVSDGLLQDAAHLAYASGVRIELESERIPILTGATLQHALTGGDDYELLFTSAAEIPELAVGTTRIGRVSEGSGVWLDGSPAEAAGYQHF